MKPAGLKNILDMDDDTRRGIASINLSVKGINIKLADKKGTLDSIAERIAMKQDQWVS